MSSSDLTCLQIQIHLIPPIYPSVSLNQEVPPTFAICRQTWKCSRASDVGPRVANRERERVDLSFIWSGMSYWDF